jgi:hypothetical protein
MRAAPARSAFGAAGFPPAAPPPPTWAFDYTAVLPFRGDPGGIAQDVISISADGDFVAQGISYGFQPAPGNEILFGTSAPSTLGAVRLGDFPLAAWLQGIRLNPRRLAETLTNDDPPQLQTGASPRAAFVEAIAPAQVRFSFTAIDTSSGRELQDQPVNNIAALGEATGRRPFRYFPQPFFLSRNATIRVQATEESEGTAGVLFFVLFGYKIGMQGCVPPPVAAPPGARTVPFDYVARVPLSGIAGRRVEREVILDTSGGFRVTSIGYAVNAESDRVRVTLPSPDPDTGTIPGLGGLGLSALPLDAWLEGVRLRPGFLKDALNDTGTGLTTDQIPLPRLDEVFQRLNGPEDTFFRYEITDGGTGRELQNRPILNIAGLGSADGRRPFKKLGRPIEFGPRSTIQVAIEEVSGRGDLFLVFQGYRNDYRSGGWQ